MTDGPLIVQSDKTVLLEVDHDQAAARSRAIAPFAELQRAPRLTCRTYRITPLAQPVERPRGGHDAEQVVDALVTFSRYAVPQPLLVGIVDTMARYGRLQLVKHPAHGLTLVSLDPSVSPKCCGNKNHSRCWARRSTRTPSWCTPASAAGSNRRCFQDRLAHRGSRRLRRREGAPHRVAAGRLAPARLPGDGRLILVRAARVWWCCRAARRQDPRRRGGDGQKTAPPP